MAKNNYTVEDPALIAFDTATTASYHALDNISRLSTQLLHFLLRVELSWLLSDMMADLALQEHSVKSNCI